ncbi:hypothetical protein CVT25_013047 [Psilocybe cyanescens]|uniref:Rhodopsin domain-containing protein n=1 Tax=Psilocybe cyanescens TaxID=93625 RepID=A0A409X0Y2_PSICY|nr:hypothetical protein CVT25_013047 [Psilocybe cyanescens]
MSKFLPNQSYLGWKIAVTVFHVIAASTTIYRLVHRFRIRRLWWDDYVLFAALIVDTAFWPIYWARSPQPAVPSAEFIKKQRVLNSYWLTMFLYILILWSCRAVMALSLVRIFPPGHKGRRWSYYLVGIMVFGGIASLIITTVTCKPASALMVASEMKNCARGVNGIVVKNTLFFVADCISDLLLIITPLVFFWRIKLPTQERCLVLVFSLGSVLTLTAAVAYVIIANTKTVASLKKNASLVNLGLAATEVRL